VDLSPPTTWRTDNSWGAGYQASVTVSNRQAYWIDDSTFSFDLADNITSIWGASIVSRTGNRYTVKTSSSPSRLDPGANLSFGFVANGTAGPGLARVVNPELRWNADGNSGTVTPPSGTASARVDYRVTSDWGSGFNGEIKITNTGSSAINGWTLKFDTTNTISSLWNGTIVGPSTGTVTVKDMGWNGTISAGGTVTIGFSANGSSAAKPVNYFLNGTALGGTSPPVPVVPAISSTSLSLSEGQSGTKAMNFTVALSQATTTTVSLRYFTTDVTATAGTDYNATSGTLTFAPGETSKTVAVTIRGDTTVEPYESFRLNFADAVNGTLAAGFVTGTIVNDDTAPAPEPPQITMNPASVTEGNSGTTPMVFMIKLSAASTSTVTVNYSTAAGTASAGTDFQATSGTLTFAPGVTSKTVTVNVIGDTVVESNETLELVLSAASGATIGVARATGTIVNDDSTVPPPSTAGKQVVGYFAEWGIYDRQYDVMDIPADKLTVVNYAFAKINTAGEIDLFDSYAAIEKSYPGDTWDQPVKGNFNQIRKLKEANPHLKVVISVGGWTLSSEFSDVALTSASRLKFADSVVRFVNQYGFDGVDLDWEYPVSGGLDSNETRPADKQNYTLLVQAIRSALNANEQTTGKDYLVTMAVPPGYSVAQNFELDKLAPLVDWMNVMAYDYHGSWDNTTGHNAPLYPNPASPFADESKFNVDYIMNYYASAGVPKSKLIMGAPVYGRSWKGVSAGPNGDGLFRPASGVGSGTWEPGSIDYSDLLNKVNTQPGTYKMFRDTASSVPYVYAPTVEGGWFSTFEDKNSLSQKIDYILANDYAGMMFWEMSADVRDSNSPDSLIGLAGNRLLSGAASSPYLTAANVAVDEGNSGTTPATVILSLSKASTQPVTVKYSTAAGTAAADADYVTASGTVTFAPGETSKSIALAIKGDAVYEPDETFQLRIEEVTGAVRATTAATVTIRNDDAPPATIDTASLKLTGTWYPGFGGEITLKNTTGTAISNGWILEFDSNFEITSIWNAEIVSRQGTRYKIRNLAWNGSLGVNSTLTFGLNGRMTGSGTNPTISNATIRPA
jgi:chitinase